MSYYHYFTTEIRFPYYTKKEEIEPIFSDLLKFYGKASFDEANTVDDVTIVLTEYPEGYHRWTPDCPPVVRIEAQGTIPSNIDIVLQTTAERLSKSNCVRCLGRCFVLTNADTMTKIRIPIARKPRDRKNAMLMSCLDDFMSEIGGLLTPAKHEELHVAMRSACLEATSPRKRITH